LLVMGKFPPMIVFRHDCMQRGVFVERAHAQQQQQQQPYPAGSPVPPSSPAFDRSGLVLFAGSVLSL
ncbi:MAG: hypothetical protein ACPIOQ_78595, partial [Promethearchaeia archaeon]